MARPTESVIRTTVSPLFLAAGALVTLLAISLTYVGLWGAWIGGVFSFPGLSWETIFFRAIYGDDAMFGTIARISSTYVFLFIIFGAFLLRSGAGDFVINLARKHGAVVISNLFIVLDFRDLQFHCTRLQVGHFRSNVMQFEKLIPTFLHQRFITLFSGLNRTV